MRINKSSRRRGCLASSVIGFVMCVLLMRTVDATSCGSQLRGSHEEEKTRMGYNVYDRGGTFLFISLPSSGNRIQDYGKIYVAASIEFE